MDDKSNEITAIPKLLMQLDIAGAVVTLDAMGCQTKVANDIIERDAENPKLLGHIVRSHWGIENKLHWVLDYAFDEDSNRSRKGNSAANMAVIRHIALNLIKADKASKIGIKNRRLKAGWDNDYMEALLLGET